MILGCRHILTGLVVLIGLAAAFFAPQFGSGPLSTIEKFGVRLAERKRLAIVSIAIAALLVRVSLLWLVPVPVAEIHDEFSYLLAGDTFAHGRLTNPPHPMWVYFETFHVIQQPTYMSKYPPAQGAVLALGRILGHPWIGVLFSVAGMCAAVLWMLQGWLPARWALLGGILVLLRFAIFGFWINSYWGGALSAIGGALVIGALPRVIHFRRPRDATIMGIGATILVNSRPFEGFVFCLPVAAVLVLWLLRNMQRDLSEILRRVVFPLCVAGLLCGLFDGYYNWRGTGSRLVFPYSLYEETYNSSIPAVQWQKAADPIHYKNPQFDAFYNNAGWARVNWLKGRIRGFRSLTSVLASDVKGFVAFFLWPELFVPLLAATPWILRDHRVRLLVIQAALCFAGFLLIVWFQPHYAAPLTATVFCLVTQGLRHLRKWRLGGRQVGIGISRVLVLLAVVLAPFHSSYADLHPALKERARIERELDSLPGQHLIIVRYSARHDALEEWVYNRADIDHAKIVWAREIPGVDIRPLLHYFEGRRVWLVEPDVSRVQLSPYAE